MPKETDMLEEEMPKETKMLEETPKEKQTSEDDTLEEKKLLEEVTPKKGDAIGEGYARGYGGGGVVGLMVAKGA